MESDAFFLILLFSAVCLHVRTNHPTYMAFTAALFVVFTASFLRALRSLVGLVGFVDFGMTRWFSDTYRHGYKARYLMTAAQDDQQLLTEILD